MGSDGTLTGLAIAGLALFAVAVVLLVVFAAVEVRRWVRAVGVRHAGPGPRFEVTFRSDLQVIDEAHELRPFLRQLLAEGRRDEALKLYRAFAGTEVGDAEAALDAFVRETGRQPRSGATGLPSDE